MRLHCGIPNWLTSVINNWCGRLFVAVRWGSCLSNQFKVTCGVR
jgi:hypothetical protein